VKNPQTSSELFNATEWTVHGVCRVCGRRHLLHRNTRTCIQIINNTLVPDNYCLRASERKSKR
jgi:hypothetical protein